MPIDKETVRPYIAEMDPGNPTTTGMSWATIGTVAGTILSAGLTALLGAYDTFKADPLLGALIAGAAMATAAVIAFKAIAAQGKKELAAVQSAERVTLAKVKAESDLAVATVTGLPPVTVAVPAAIPGPTTTTNTTTTTQPEGNP